MSLLPLLKAIFFMLLTVPILGHAEEIEDPEAAFYRIAYAMFQKISNQTGQKNPQSGQDRWRVAITDFRQSENEKPCESLSDHLEESISNRFSELNGLVSNKFIVVSRSDMKQLQKECSKNQDSGCTYEELSTKSDILITGKWDNEGWLSVKAMLLSGEYVGSADKKHIDVQRLPKNVWSCWELTYELIDPKTIDIHLAQVQKQIKDEQDKLTKLQQQVNDKNATLGTIQGHIKNAQIKLNGLVAETSRLQTLAAEHQQLAQNKQQQQYALDQQLQTAQAELKKLTDQRNSEELRLAGLQQQYQQLEHAKYQAQRQLDNANARLAQATLRPIQEQAAPVVMLKNNQTQAETTRVTTIITIKPIAKATATTTQNSRQDFEPELVEIPTGKFDMGTLSYAKDWNSAESPVHEVQIPTFFMSKYEITNAQFREFRPQHDSGKHKNISLNDDNQPVAKISWDDALAYTQWLVAETGKPYRLPTESEWEYAARAGTTTTFHWGDKAKNACLYANVADLTAKKKFNWDDTQACTDKYAVSAPVGKFKPNAFSLYDMAGNVMEWVQDCWHDDYNGATVNGSAWQDECTGNKVVRGGSWQGVPDILYDFKSAYRYQALIESVNIGLRVVCDAPCTAIK